jgi:peptidase E
MKKKPVYLLAGGRGSSYATIYKEVLKEILAPQAVVAYVGAANNDDERFYKFMGDEIIKSGNCTLRNAALASPKADVDKAREILQQADAVFMSGGDVEAGIQVVESRKLTSFFRELYEQGKVFFGVSAGSIMLAKEWVRWEDPNDDASAGIFPCLDIAPVLVDTHAEDNDWEELKVALKLGGPGGTGYGIPTGACLKVYPDRRVEALARPVARFVNRDGEVVKIKDLMEQ